MNGERPADIGSRSLMVAAQLAAVDQSRARKQAGMTGEPHGDVDSRSLTVAAQVREFDQSRAREQAGMNGERRGFSTNPDAICLI